MTTPYKKLTDEQKERQRQAVRKYAAKNDRTEYYKEYEKGRSRTKEGIMFNNSRRNARVKNLPHSISIEDIVIPEICPCCDNKIERPSLDRVDNAKGYIKTNIQVICTSCNSIKRDGDADLHRKIANYIEKHSF